MKSSSSRKRTVTAGLLALLSLALTTTAAAAPVSAAEAEIQKLERELEIKKLQFARAQIDAQLAELSAPAIPAQPAPVARSVPGAGVRTKRSASNPPAGESAVDDTKKTESAVPEIAYAAPTSGVTAFFHGGVRLLSPYKLRFEDQAGQKHAFLEKGDDPAAGFLEFVYSNRWAWNERRVRVSSKNANGHSSDGTPFLTASGDFWDFDTRFTYNFSKGSDNDPSAIVGSGDFGLEITASKHLSRAVLAEDWATGAYSIGLDLSYGLTTERSAFDAHHRFFAGPSYSLSYGLDKGTERWVLLNTRVGYAAIESVKYKSKASREVALEYGDVPRYYTSNAVGFETELIYPIGRDAALTMGARIYGGLNPNPWTVYIGYTKSITDLAKAIFPKSADENSGGGAAPAPGKTPAPKKTPAL